MAKLITFGKDREETIQRMRRALSMFVVDGIHTTIPLHEQILQNEEFLAGRFDTAFLTRLHAEVPAATTAGD